MEAAENHARVGSGNTRLTYSPCTSEVLGIAFPIGGTSNGVLFGPTCDTTIAFSNI